MALLGDTNYLSFPLRVDRTTGQLQVSGRAPHIRQQIEQVLFTDPGERVFRPEFGVGVRAMVFEPNGTALWELTRKRLLSSLAEALKGEVDPKSLQVNIDQDKAAEAEGKLIIVITYILTAIRQNERQEFSINSG